MEDFTKWVMITVIAAIISAAMSLIFAFPVMWLWNAFMPAVLGAKAITWTETLCLYVLCSTLSTSHFSSRSK